MSVAEAPPPAPVLPGLILTKLDRLRAHLRRLTAVHGVTWIAIVVLGIAVSTFALDRLLHLPRAFRAVLLLGGIGAVAYAFHRFLVRPLLFKLKDDEVAILVEREYRELNDELISAVQLASAPAEIRQHYSAELAGAVVAEAGARVEALDFERVAKTREVARVAVATVALAAVIGVASAKFPDLARIWFERQVLLRSTPWPREVDLTVSVSPEEKTVARGDSVTVTARVLAGAPSEVIVQPRARASGEDLDEIPMTLSSKDSRVWRCSIHNVNEPFRFYVEGGDYRSDWIEIDVKPRPTVDSILLWVDNPDYLGEPDTPETEPLRNVSPRVPAGAVVRYVGIVNTPLRAASLEIDEPEAVSDVDGPAIDPGDPRRIAGRLRVFATTTLRFDLVSADGFESGEAPGVKIIAVPDALPKITIRRPAAQGPMPVTRRAEVALEVDISDSYGLKAADLVIAIQPRLKPAGAKEEVRYRGLVVEPPGTEKALVKTTIEVADLPVEVGDRVSYWVEATDGRDPGPTAAERAAGRTTGALAHAPAGSPVRGSSLRLQLLIQSDEEIQRALETRLKRIRDDLQGAARVQREAQDKVASIAARIGASPEAPATDPKVKGGLADAVAEEREILDDLAKARAAVLDIAEDMAANGLAKKEDLAWLGQLATALEAIEQGPGREAVVALQRERQAEKADAAALGAIAAKQEEVAEAILEVVRRLDKWDEYNEVIRELRDLIEIQERVRRLTQERAKKDFGR